MRQDSNPTLQNEGLCTETRGKLVALTNNGGNKRRVPFVYQTRRKQKDYTHAHLCGTEVDRLLTSFYVMLKSNCSSALLKSPALLQFCLGLSHKLKSHMDGILVQSLLICFSFAKFCLPVEIDSSCPPSISVNVQVLYNTLKQL